MDAIERLARLRHEEHRLALGLMSGMSGDGLDLALVRLEGLGPRPAVTLVASTTWPYPGALRARLRAALNATTPEVCALGFDLARTWADRVRIFLADARVDAADVDVLGSHGQTLCHVPRHREGAASTLQVGDGDVLAEATGLLTVSDLRPRDIAAGGGGAPLVPFADWVLYAEPGATVACHNLGSIANVTVVPERLDDVRAFDTGPANALIDGVVRLRTGDATAIDDDGRGAARGRVLPAALAMLARHAAHFLAEPPPRSAGYEEFGPPLAAKLLEHFPDASTEDLLRTAVAFTATTVADAYRRWVVPRHPTLRTVRLSGGGAHNPTLVEAIAASVRDLGLIVSPLRTAWIDAKEAVAFALLADATVRGIPAGVPGATGARRPVLLGKISLADGDAPGDLP